jgi:hypothetical protein
LTSITDITTLIALIVAAGAAGAGLGVLLGDIPEALAEEYVTELPPGGGLPFDELPSGGAGIVELTEEAAIVLLAVDHDTPPGGGYAYGGLSTDGTASEGGIISGEEGWTAAPAGAPDSSGGGYPMNEIWEITGGNVDTLEIGEALPT